MAVFSPPSSIHFSTISATTTFSSKTHFTSSKPYLHFPSKLSKKNLCLLSTKISENEAVVVEEVETVVVEEIKKEEPEVSVQEEEPSLGSNGGVSAAVTTTTSVEEPVVLKFTNPKWVSGTWDLKQFQKNGETDWDAVIDAEVRRRKWLEDNPETSSNDDPIVFDTSIIPWWSWVKRFHLPEAEKLNGRAAMVGFFMAYFVDSLTGVGLVDQMGNFFCKTLLLAAVVGVLAIRKNEDVDNLKKLWEETTFYDKQWQATWQDDSTSGSKKK
ncbi:hypothetical protein MKX03_021569 [Papaver bracteatum]|nr:hypothetical protein MKX03_021569 [Papaver bracteatum]